MSKQMGVDESSLFMRAITEIETGAGRLHKAVGDESGYTSDIDDGMMQRIPTAAYCLKLAHRVWEQTRPEFIAAMARANEPPMPHPMLHRLLAGNFGAGAYASEDAFAPSDDAEKISGLLLQRLHPDILQKVTDTLVAARAAQANNLASPPAPPATPPQADYSHITPPPWCQWPPEQAAIPGAITVTCKLCRYRLCNTKVLPAMCPGCCQAGAHTKEPTP